MSATTSRRTLNKTEGISNPAKKFLEWKSNDKCFAYWDKEAKENVQIQIPVKFQFLEHFHTVKGWNDASESGMYSNEVKFISKEPLSVRAFKASWVIEGLYSENRGAIRDAGGKYFRSVYCIDENGEIVNLQLKGAVVSAYSDFMEKYENQVEGNWIEIKSVSDHKKGATKYSTPDFTIGKAFTKAEMELANEKYQDIVAHYEAKNSTKLEDVEVESELVEDHGLEKDDLEF